jgi:hypothetical protein
VLLGFLLLWCATTVAQGSHPQPNDTGTITLKKSLAQIITTPPDVVQFSKDKKYEEAWIIKSSSARPSADQWKRYIDKERFEVLIVEYVWNSEDDDNRFVLTLFQDKRVKMRNPEEFVKTCLDLFYSKPDFLTLMNTLDAEVIGRLYLLQNPADEVTIGIFNYWFSTGPVNLWKRGDGSDGINRIETCIDVLDTGEYVNLTMLDRRVAQIYVSTDRRATGNIYNSYVIGLSNKYGRPDKLETKHYRNGVETGSSGEHLRWLNGDQYMDASEIERSITIGSKNLDTTIDEQKRVHERN